jgi:hypothetical protein
MTTVQTEIKNIKNHAALVEACAGKYLVIHSSGKPGRDYTGKRKNKGGLEQIFIFSSLSDGLVPRMADLYNGYGEFSSLAKDLDPAPYLSSNEIFEFFLINKYQKNRIYITDSLPIIDEMKALKARLVDNLRAEAELLTEDVTHAVGTKNVMAGCYAVVNRVSFSTRRVEFDYDRKGYSYYCTGASSSEEPSLVEGRVTGRAGFSREEKVYRVSKKTCNELFRLFNERIEIITTAREKIRAFIISEEATAKKGQAKIYVEL